MRVNENLDINPTHYLDINHADIVARIDLTEWGNQSRVDPLSHFPERASRAQSGGFLYGFPRCQRRLNAKAQNRGLLQAVDDFTAEATG